jgi:hypothetical protein
MPLFHPRVIQKRLSAFLAVPPQHKAILDGWAKSLSDGVSDKETQNDSEFIQRILVEVLGYVGSSSGKNWTVAKNQPVGTGNVDVALGNFSSDGVTQILAPFELKGARTKDLDAMMSGRNKSPVQQAWEYAMDAPGSQWVLVSNYKELRLYAIGYGRKNYESFDLAHISDPSSYQRFLLLLGAHNLLSGNTLRLLKESETTEKEITKELYADYRQVRSELISEVSSATGWSLDKVIQTSQTILDRVLFVAFAEDKGLLKKNTLKETFSTKNPYSPQPAWDNFKGLFDAIDKGNEKLNIPGYNGGLFASEESINQLALSEAICERFAKLGNYDYDSEVSVNILGHVFEQSISDLEELKKPSDQKDDDVGAKRRSDGIFYTPPFVTRRIVEQSVGKWLADRKEELGFYQITPLTDEDYATIKVVERGQKRGQVVFNNNVKAHVKLWEAYKARVSSIRVLDPACGSGAFLNEVFDFLFQEGQIINRTLETFYGGQISLFRWDTHILSNNVFGVDLNRESVEITKLSLWLKTANRNEKLSYLDDNIKAGNSLIKDEAVAGDLAFDWERAFPKIMASGRFDIVLGNPPYVDSEAMAKVWPREREYITKNFSHTRGNWDLYIAFLELGCDLLGPHGYLSFITPDKWISKDFGAEIRKRVLPGLISILPIGRDVFESALVDSIITTVSHTPVDMLEIRTVRDGEEILIGKLLKVDIDSLQGFDQLLSTSYGLIQTLENAAPQSLGKIAIAENACATSDTYILGDIVEEAGSQHGYNASKHYKVANTGTLDPFVFRWGFKPMRYLGKDLLFPVVAKGKFSERLGKTYQRRAASPKVIVKGLTLLDAAIDLDASYIPGKATLVICDKDPVTLKFVAAVLNSKYATFYVTQKYASASYNGGVNFTTDMLNALPVPEVKPSDFAPLVDRLLACHRARLEISSEVQKLIRASSHPKLKRKLETWYTLSEQEFLEQLASQGLKLSLQDRSEWLDLFCAQKAKIAVALDEINSMTSEIDDRFYTAFGLSVDDRAAIEASN